MNRLARLVALSLALAGCGFSAGNWSTGVVRPAGGVERDTAPPPPGRASDTAPPSHRRAGDGEPGRAAGGPAVARDAGECGDLGRACGPGTCPDDLYCENGACVRSNDMCGGSGAAACPSSAPVCLAYPWATGWPCVSREDRDCICATPAGRAGFRSVCAGTPPP